MDDLGRVLPAMTARAIDGTAHRLRCDGGAAPVLGAATHRTDPFGAAPSRMTSYGMAAHGTALFGTTLFGTTLLGTALFGAALRPRGVPV